MTHDARLYRWDGSLKDTDLESTRRHVLANSQTHTHNGRTSSCYRYLSIHLSISVSLLISINPSRYLSINLSIQLSIPLANLIYINPSIHLFVYQSLFPYSIQLKKKLYWHEKYTFTLPKQVNSEIKRTQSSRLCVALLNVCYRVTAADHRDRLTS